MVSDRIFGFVMFGVALVYVATALQIQTSFLSDPVGPKSFPITIGVVVMFCSLVLISKPDPDPDWPTSRTFSVLLLTIITLVGYAFALKSLGFIVPTFAAACILSYQIRQNLISMLLTGTAISAGLFVLFRYAFDLGLMPFPAGILE